MNKEKQIEEIAHILCGMENSCDECIFDKVKCYERLDAEQIYNAGYRKATDIVKEIFKELESVFYLASYTVQRPMGSLTTKTVEGIHMRNEDYHTIKKKYTQEK